MKNRPPRKSASAPKRASGSFKAGSGGKFAPKGDSPRATGGKKAAPAKRSDSPRATAGKSAASPKKRGEKAEAPPRTAGTARPKAKTASRPQNKSFAKNFAKPASHGGSRFVKKTVAAPAAAVVAPSPKKAAPRIEKKRPIRSEAKELHLTSKGLLLWGVHAAREAWLNKRRRCHTLWVTDSGLAAMQDALDQAAARGLPRPAITKVERADLDRLLPRGSVHQGIALELEPLNDMTIDDLLGLDEPANLVILLDQVTDPHNVGAILRSAAAFGADAVIVTERNAPTTTGILAKAACGAVEHVPLIPVVNLSRTIEALQAESFWCVGLAEEGAKDLSESSLGTGRIALVMGAEGDGLRRLTREHCDELARLPTSGPIGSLNVSNAAVVALYEVIRQKG